MLLRARSLSYTDDDQMDTHAGGFHSVHRRVEVSHGILALVSTICGGGSLSIPWAFARSGVFVGLLVLILSAWLSAQGVHFLLGGARRAGGLRTFDSVLEKALGPLARMLTICSVVVTCFLTLIANSLLLRQLSAPLMAEYVLERAMTRNEEVALGTGLVAMIVPLTYLSSLHSLRCVSLMSVSSVFALVCVLAYKGFSCAPQLTPDGWTSSTSAVTTPVESGSIVAIIRSLPVFVCIYICSFSALPLDTELRRPSRKRMTLMVIGAFTIAFCLYAVAGLAGLAYGTCTQQDVPSNVLAMFKKGDGPASVLRVLLSIVLLLSLPLICLPCRNMIQQLDVSCRDSSCQSCVGSLRLALSKVSPTLGAQLLQSPLPSPTGGSLRLGDGFEGSDSSDGDDEASIRAGNVFSDGDTISSHGSARPPVGGTPSSIIATEGAVIGGSGSNNARLEKDTSTAVHHLHSPLSTVTVPGAGPPLGINSRSRSSSVGEVYSVLVKEEQAGEMPLRTRVVISSGLMGAALACTAAVDDVSVVWGFLGSTCGILLSYVLPAASYLLLRRTPKPKRSGESRGAGPSNLRRRHSSVPRRKVAALMLVAVGCALIPICLYNTAQAIL